ncbi:MAG: Rieske 2Fe-2S domain-containing protein [Ardenticatenales bacterium]|nr:Rieske 2Fe-2S domain-containing protein [Ardenticatenales bacterium]
MGQWVNVGSKQAVQEGQMFLVQLEGQPIALTMEGGKLYAFRALCPHASADLTQGDLRPGMVICPLHAYRFDLRTGICLKPREGGPRLRIYPVERRGDQVWVLLP